MAFGIHLQLRHNGAEQYGGPLFWAHYSFLWLDPRNLSDQYANYWDGNYNHSLIDYRWCLANPLGYKGYGPDLWGMTCSNSPSGYSCSDPGNASDTGVTAPTAALSSMPYMPQESIAFLKNINQYDILWNVYGFFDAFSEQFNWLSPGYLAIDQGPIVDMIENHRTGLLWNLFMRNPEIKKGLKKLGFSSPWIWFHSFLLNLKNNWIILYNFER